MQGGREGKRAEIDKRTAKHSRTEPGQKWMIGKGRRNKCQIEVAISGQTDNHK